jgi:hypothetical protein
LLALQKCKPLPDIKYQIEAVPSSAMPKSMLVKACNYTLTLRTRLTRFLDYPVLELSNSSGELRIVPWEMGLTPNGANVFA